MLLVRTELNASHRPGVSIHHAELNSVLETPQAHLRGGGGGWWGGGVVRRRGGGVVRKGEGWWDGGMVGAVRSGGVVGW